MDAPMISTAISTEATIERPDRIRRKKMIHRSGSPSQPSGPSPVHSATTSNASGRPYPSARSRTVFNLANQSSSIDVSQNRNNPPMNLEGLSVAERRAIEKERRRRKAMGDHGLAHDGSADPITVTSSEPTVMKPVPRRAGKTTDMHFHELFSDEEQYEKFTGKRQLIDSQSTPTGQRKQVRIRSKSKKKDQSKKYVDVSPDSSVHAKLVNQMKYNPSPLKTIPEQTNPSSRSASSHVYHSKHFPLGQEGPKPQIQRSKSNYLVKSISKNVNSVAKTTTNLTGKGVKTLGAAGGAVLNVGKSAGGAVMSGTKAASHEAKKGAAVATKATSKSAKNIKKKLHESTA